MLVFCTLRTVPCSLRVVELPWKDYFLFDDRAVTDVPHARHGTSMERVVWVPCMYHAISVELLKKGFPAVLPPRGKCILARLSSKPECTSDCQSDKK